MARKRRTRYTWLPNTGTAGPVADVEDTTNGRDFGNITVPSDGTSLLTIIDLLDDDATEEQATGPMGPIIGSEYFLKRIVGKFFVQMSQVAADSPPFALVSGGIFVARADDVDTVQDLPIGAATQAQAIRNYSPLREEVIREPWIWRRTWVLSNRQSTVGTFGVNENIPTSSMEYGSVADGPHIDAKTARRVGNDDRLWAVLAVRSFPLNSVVGIGTPGNINGYIDYRALGALRKARNRSAF